MPDAPGGVTRLDRLLPVLERLAGGRVRVWRVKGGGGGRARLLAGPGETPSWSPPLDGDSVVFRWDCSDGLASFELVQDAEGVWL